MEKYGAYFKSLREAANLTLREVEKKTEISNAYLSQLESEKIKQPSPAILNKLAELYGVKYEQLMRKVGYPVPQSQSSSNKAYNKISDKVGHITDEEELELINYLKFIRKRK